MTHSTGPESYLDQAETAALDAHWRAANYLAVGQIHLLANPLLTEPLRPEHIKPRLNGHWGTSPGLNLIHTHLNRVITARRRETLCVWGPGHGAPAVLANSWLDGTYTEVYPEVGRDAAGMRRLFRQFSFPGGVPSHVAPETPGSIHEGGELGYALAHAYGAAFDNPGLLVACVIGDGEAETGPLAASWHSNKFLDARHDGAVLPILHLNGYKIANPTLLARLPAEELDAMLRGFGHQPLYVDTDDTSRVHDLMARAMDTALDLIDTVQREARLGEDVPRRPWPLIVLRTPKGWTGPTHGPDGPVQDTWRSHQVPLSDVRDDPEQRRQLEAWMRSYRPAELFDERGRPRPAVLAPVPTGELRLGAGRHANAGALLRPLPLPSLEEHAVPVSAPGRTSHEATRVLGGYFTALMEATARERTFRLVGPDETASNKLEAVYAGSGRAWQGGERPTDEELSRHGRVMEILSEHTCQGWLEGYLLTGRHGVFVSYEAFIRIVDSMAAQHVKWLRTARRLPWRHPVASFNYLLTSHVWRQDSNGFSHQDPGFPDHILSKAPEVVRVHLPPDTNTLLVTADHALTTRDQVNVIIASKHPGFDWLSLDDARAHCARGAGIWRWAGTEEPGRAPDIVLGCAGEVPTKEVLAAAQLLRTETPGLSVRVVNVVDLARLLPPGEHPDGLTDEEFTNLFPAETPVVFAHHGYPALIHHLVHGRAARADFHVRGYREEGTTTTPFDMLVRNDLDRYRLALDALTHAVRRPPDTARARRAWTGTRHRHTAWIRSHGTDLPEVDAWRWAG
ncbi:phosphoketolase [Streptomyces sp. NPDC049813]|uniref:phosphoketolase n=1 Tax=Streptomyces sp. NPDC049813 TaxID=3365597 RepID=UPI0037AB68E3